MNTCGTHVAEADLTCGEHCDAVVELTDAYAADPMGNGAPLPAEVRDALVPGLREHPTTVIFLAWQSGTPVGIATCFRGFSTFSARPLINISDFYVITAYRGQGIGKALLEAVECKARESGCCRLTLEMQENNRRARAVYEGAGFSQAVYVEEAGGSLYMWKPL